MSIHFTGINVKSELFGVVTLFDHLSRGRSDHFMGLDSLSEAAAFLFGSHAGSRLPFFC